MRVAIDEYKLSSLIKTKILKFKELCTARVSEINKEVDYSDLNLTQEDITFINEFLNNPDENKEESSVERAKKILDTSYQYIKRSDLKVITLEELRDIFNLTVEEAESVILNTEEFKE